MADIIITVGDAHLTRVADAFAGERLTSGGLTLEETLAAAGQTQAEQRTALVSFMEAYFFKKAKDRVHGFEANQAAVDYISTASDLI